MVDFFPAGWTDEGLIYAPFRLGMLDGLRVDPLDTLRPDAIVLRWRERFELRLSARFPNATIETLDRSLAFEWKPMIHGSRERFGERILGLLACLDQHAPQKVADRGWAGFPEVAWEVVGSLPEPLTEEKVGAGAFRSAPRPNEDPAIAIRRPEGSLATLLRWLGSSPERPFRVEPREVRLTATHVYVARRDGSLGRVPRDAIRRRDGGPGIADALYTFGRRTELLLVGGVLNCEVARALEADLARE